MGDEEVKATERPWHTPLSLRFDDLPLGRASIWDAKGYSLILNARLDVAREFVRAANAHDALVQALRDISGVGHVPNPNNDKALARANDKLDQVIEWAEVALKLAEQPEVR